MIFGERKSVKTEFLIKSNTKAELDINKRNLSEAALTQNRFIKSQVNNSTENFKEDVPALKNVDADINVDIGNVSGGESKKAF